MSLEKSEIFAMTSGSGDAMSEDTVCRHPWHKPTIARIEIKRTLDGGGSSPDGFPPGTT
jgi:hypothetical protein